MARVDDIFRGLNSPTPSDPASDDTFIDVPATSMLIGGLRITDLITDYNFLEGDNVNLTALFTTDLNNSDGGTNTSGASLEANAKGNSDVSAVAGIQLAQANVGGQQPENQVFDAENAKVSDTFSSTEFGTRIVLSPGTATDRVSIEDGNLYLVQKAGTVVVIEDGATFYPTLVIAPGIIIPANKLQAALENAQEGTLTTAPDAERGSQSSGGNFVVDPGGIGDPVDLTPLLLPTVLSRTINFLQELGADEEGRDEADSFTQDPTRQGITAGVDIVGISFGDDSGVSMGDIIV